MRKRIKAVMAGVCLGILAPSSAYAEDVIPADSFRGENGIYMGEYDEEGNPIPVTIGDTMTEEEKEQRMPTLSIKETGEGNLISAMYKARDSKLVQYINLYWFYCFIVLDNLFLT